MKIRRFLASLLCGLMLISNTGVQVFADTDAMTSSLTATSEMIGSDLVVVIPDSIPLTQSDDAFVGTDKVVAYGATSPTAILTVTTNPQVTYENQYLTDITVDAEVTFGTDCVATWTARELKDNISADPMLGYEVTTTVPMEEVKYIGTYKTNILFNISLETNSEAVVYYMGYDYSDSSSVSYENQTDIAYDILPQTSTVAELKEFSTDKSALEAKGYDVILESADENLVIPSDIEGVDVVGVSFDTFFADEDIATYVDEIQIPSSIIGIELTDNTASASTTVITCESVRTAVNLSKQLPSSAKIRFQFEANGERDYTEFFTYYKYGGEYYVTGYSEYGCEQLSSYGGGATVEVTMPVTYQGNKVVGVRFTGYDDCFVEALASENYPYQEWVFPSSYTTCYGFWNNSYSKNNVIRNLTKVTMNNGLTYIENDAFKSIESLTSVNIPGTVTTLGSYAFTDCINLSSVTFDEGITSLANSTNAFYNTALTSVTFPSTLTEVNDQIFGNEESSNNYNSSVKVINWNINHDAVTNSDLYHLKYTLFCFADGNYIGYDKDNMVAQQAHSTDGVNAVIDFNIADKQFKNTEAMAYSNIVIAEGVTSIGEEAFYNYTSANSAEPCIKITLPSTITSIGAYAFQNKLYTFDTVDLRNLQADTSGILGARAFGDATIENLIIKSNDMVKNGLAFANIKNLYIDYSSDESAVLPLVANATYGTTLANVYFSGSEDDFKTFLSGTASGSSNALYDAYWDGDDSTVNFVFNAEMP